MSQNFLRTCTLSLGGATVQGGGDTDLRIVFSIEQWGGQTPNMARFRVYNPSQSLANKLQANPNTKVQFSAGYQSNNALVFSGEVKQTIGGHESAVDTYVDIFCADSQLAYNTARVSKTLAAGYTPKDKVDTAIQAMGQYGVSLGLVNVDLSQPKFPRGLPLIGMARNVLREVAFLKGALWSVQNGQVHIIDHRQPIQSDTITMNGNTGMVGWPRQTQDGIIVTSLLNPKLQPHVKLKIDPNAIIQAEQDNSLTGAANPQNVWLNQQNVTAGVYTAFKVNRHGDTRGAEWFDESICIGAGGLLSPGALSQNYNLGTN